MEGLGKEMTELEHIQSFFSHETLSTMTKNHKVAYKYCLGAIFINIIVGGGHGRGQEENFGIAEGVKKLPRKETDFDRLVDGISAKVHDSLERNHFIKPYDVALLDKLIIFTRKRILEISEKDKSLFQASELMDIIDLKSFFGIRSVEKHHWLDFDLHSGLVLTLPEAIVFHDLKVHWNEFIRLFRILEEERAGLGHGKERFEYFNMEATREKLYKRAASARALIFLCVSFVESYLLNLFYTIRESEVPGKETAAGMLALTKIEDETIVKAVIYKIFPEYKASIEDMFKAYMSTTKFRNRYVHASPFMEASTSGSAMQPLLNVTDDLVFDSLQNAVNFVRTLDRLLPENLKLLFWWYDEEEVVFRNYQPLKLTNSYSRYNRMKYEKG
jgi:hypothetical protein